VFRRGRRGKRGKDYSNSKNWHTIQVPQPRNCCKQITIPKYVSAT
jgi:hypothetical protein